MKRILIIAGPNGAGKTTYAETYLEEGGYRHFVNADLIAKGISPFDPDAAAVRAGRVMLELLDDLVEQGESFAFETTLSGLTYVAKIRLWKSLEYEVRLLFVQLDSADLAVRRVSNRVREGGHNIPEEVIRRRFEAGIKNFQDVYRDLVDDWILVDNSGESAVIIERKRRDESLE